MLVVLRQHTQLAARAPRRPDPARRARGTDQTRNGTAAVRDDHFLPHPETPDDLGELLLQGLEIKLTLIGHHRASCRVLGDDWRFGATGQRAGIAKDANVPAATKQAP
jgi:hypothetical protein